MYKLFKDSDSIGRIREKLSNRQKDLDGLKAFATSEQLKPLVKDIKALQSRIKQLEKPKSPRNFTPSRLRKQLQEKQATLQMLQQMGENTTELEKEIRSINKKLATKKSTTSPKFTPERLRKQLQEKQATLLMLQQMGENTTELEKEISSINRKLSAKAAGPVAHGMLNIKVLCFDLDETILTSTDPSVNAGGISDLQKLGQVNISSSQSRPDMADVIVNKYVVRLLEECTRRPNVKWFIVSRGNNTENVRPDNMDLGVDMFNNTAGRKRPAVERILGKLRTQFNIEGVLFADDDRRNIDSVKSIDNIRPVKVPEGSWTADWLPITLLTNDNIRECLSFIEAPMGQLKRKKNTKRKPKGKSKDKDKAKGKSKGKAKGKSKGKAKGKAKGKSKGKAKR